MTLYVGNLLQRKRGAARMRNVQVLAGLGEGLLHAFSRLLPAAAKFTGFRGETTGPAFQFLPLPKTREADWCGTHSPLYACASALGGLVSALCPPPIEAAHSPDHTMPTSAAAAGQRGDMDRVGLHLQECP